ncbi:hypothetical protein NUU61_005094 [Penicillium alfredii]|uniref:F-box domain-containing protein n=1 Tax=Penicillium alfredii TaxID=1506179 RepID=A0A9W9F8X1_9EURO|nr:uncharacterized protein NUU61_005094 [Penicillium alfredii]KAJ5095738.1 hypothetical protein NUU61_005094 [Penicillium alfredii]
MEHVSLPGSDQGPSPVSRLPSSVIERILYVADANTFASLALLSRAWRHASDSPSLYAYHLSRCPSLSWTSGSIAASAETDLQILKRQFIEEVRRNAFDVFMRPRRTLVRLISSSMSSSTAFPQGEVFRFSFSAKGQLVLCISSSRIVVLSVVTDPVTVKHELKTRRRPLGATIRDDGSLLAVLSSSHRVNIYRLSDDEAKHIQTITLNDAPRDLKFSPAGSVLALSFEDSIEVHAVGESALATDRRAVRCLRVDALTFSSDSSMLLGSPSAPDQNGIVTITAPFYTETGTDASPEEVQMRMWTTQILFPETISGFTHACLVSGHEESEDSWILAYDRQLAAFRAIQMNNADAGVVYFASPFLREESREMQPNMTPATDDAGELVALGFQNSELWIYGVPGRLDPPVTSSNAGTRNEISGSHHSRSPRDNLAQLQKIVQHPKFLIRGRRVTDMAGITTAQWVTSPNRRLVAVAPGGVRPQIFGEEDVPVDGGRMLLLDFERSTRDGETHELDIEVGETAPKMLLEPNSSMDTEVELERRRTRLHRGDTDIAALAHRMSRPPLPEISRTASTAIPHLRRNSMAISPDEMGHPDLPYDNLQPRSRDTLHRSATAAAATRERYDPRYRNNPSRRHIPHESDADNWIPPPPPYTRNADQPLPTHLQETLLPRRPIECSNDAMQRAQTTRVPRTTQARPRPQSAILQRLGTITSTRRGRRNSTLAPEPDSTQPITRGPAPNGNHGNDWRRPNTTAPPVPPINYPYQHPTLAMHPAEPQQPISALNWGAEAAEFGNTFAPYSMSSPNLLHTLQPHGNFHGLASPEDETIPERQRSFRRRVSTEPTSLPPPENQEWRRRIQEWNENTIRERSRKRRSKCIVM